MLFQRFFVGLFLNLFNVFEHGVSSAINLEAPLQAALFLGIDLILRAKWVAWRFFLQLGVIRENIDLGVRLQLLFQRKHCFTVWISFHRFVAAVSG